MGIYKFLANELLNSSLEPDNSYIRLNNFGKDRWFGFKYRGYKGLMAKPRGNNTSVERSKEGYFDIFIYTGTRYEDRNGYRPITHYNAFQDLLENSNLKNCYRIWNGENPMNVTSNREEQQALCSLALLMFEQELNWGNECWQRNSNFQPSIAFPYQRPRDMIMGFLKIVFHYANVDEIPDWNYRKNKKGEKVKATPTFKDGYKNLEVKYKIFFEELQSHKESLPLMSGDYPRRFREKIKLIPNNEFYNKDISNSFTEEVAIKEIEMGNVIKI